MNARYLVFAIALLTTAVGRADDPWHLLDPIWSSKTVHGESVLFVQDTPEKRPNARLLLPVKRMIEVIRADRSQAFEEGRDYAIDRTAGTLELPEGSRIPFITGAELFPPKGSERSIPHKSGDESRDVLCELKHWFHDHQLEITYEPAEPWSGYRPTVASKSLARTIGKLKRGEPLTIGVSGDSITTGVNASLTGNVPPQQPGYAQLVADQLQRSFGSPIKLVNRAVVGWRVEDGLKDLDVLLAERPDVVVIAYGMNHFGSRDPEAFKRALGVMIQRIRATDTDIEIILVAPMHGNSDWIRTPREQFAPHRDAIASFVGARIAMTDLTTLWGEMLKRKRDCDLTGNGVNHPNDFGHRLYAQAVLGLLLESGIAERNLHERG